MNRSVQATNCPFVCSRFCTAFFLILALAALVGCQGFSSGNSSTPAQLQASMSAINFGSVKIGTKQTQSETLNNPGSTALNLTGATITGSTFSVTGLTLPATLAAGQSVTFTVAFAPKSAAASSGSIAI